MAEELPSLMIELRARSLKCIYIHIFKLPLFRPVAFGYAVRCYIFSFVFPVEEKYSTLPVSNLFTQNPLTKQCEATNYHRFRSKECVELYLLSTIRGRTIKFANSPPCACSGSTGQKPYYGLMTLTYQRLTAVLLLIYGSLFLSGIYYCLRVFWCAAARISELQLEQGRF